MYEGGFPFDAFRTYYEEIFEGEAEEARREMLPCPAGMRACVIEGQASSYDVGPFFGHGAWNTKLMRRW